LLLTYHRARTLTLIAPSLLIAELGLMLASIKGGFTSAYMQAIAAIWLQRRNIWKTRHVLQTRRRVEDSDYLKSGKQELPGALNLNPALTIILSAVQALQDLNWELVRLVDQLAGRLIASIQSEDRPNT
jgi:hypothetical protein